MFETKDADGGNKDSKKFDIEAPLAEVKDQIAEVMTAVKHSQDKNDENLKNHDVLNKEQIERVNKWVGEKLDEISEATAKREQRIKNLEAALNRVDQGGDAASKELEIERAKAFDNFIRNTTDGKKELEILDQRMAEAKDMTTEVNPDGGYLVRPEFSDFIVSRIFETSPIRRISNIETIGGKSLIMLIDDDEAADGWVGEGGTITTTATPQVGELEITAHKLFALPKVTTEMLEDGFFDVENWLMRKVAERFSRSENTAFVSGNTGKRPKGFTSYANWAAPGVYERNKVERIVSGNATAITADGLIDLQNSLLEPYQPNATWVMLRATYGDVMKLKDGEQRYLFNISLDMNTGLPGANLLTRPVMFGADMPAVGAGNLAIAYGDFGMGYTVVDRLGITILRDPFTSLGFIQFFTTKRTGGAVTNFEAIKLQSISA